MLGQWLSDWLLVITGVEALAIVGLILALLAGQPAAERYNLDRAHAASTATEIARLTITPAVRTPTPFRFVTPVPTR